MTQFLGRKNEPRWIIVHHTGGTDLNPLADTSHHTFEIVNNWHRQLWPNFPSFYGVYIGYHWLIEKDGKLRKGREEYEEGAHCKGMNISSIGICLAGNFDRTIGTANCYPTEAQIQTLKNLLVELTKKYNISPENIVPHRYFAFGKTCYGKGLHNDWAKNLVKEESELERIQKQISFLQQQILALMRLIERLKVQLGGVFVEDPFE